MLVWCGVCVFAVHVPPPSLPSLLATAVENGRAQEINDIGRIWIATSKLEN